MKRTPLQILIEDHYGDLKVLVEDIDQFLELERKMIIDAFNACAMEEILNNKRYINGEDYYEQNYNSYDYDLTNF